MYVGNCTPKHSFRFQKKLRIWACIFKYTSKIFDFRNFIHSQIFSKYAENVHFVLIISFALRNFIVQNEYFLRYDHFQLEEGWPGFLTKSGPVYWQKAQFVKQKQKLIVFFFSFQFMITKSGTCCFYNIFKRFEKKNHPVTAKIWVVRVKIRFFFLYISTKNETSSFG